MKANRGTQPYRKGPRAPGAALVAMLRGRTAGGFNSADTTRAAQAIKRAGERQHNARAARGSRPPRAPR